MLASVSIRTSMLSLVGFLASARDHRQEKRTIGARMISTSAEHKTMRCR